MTDDLYRILGLKRDADLEQIKQAYRSEVKRCHPDASGTGGSAERFRAVEEAYETLRDADRRKAYDRELRQQEFLPARPEARGGSGTASEPFVAAPFGPTKFAGTPSASAGAGEGFPFSLSGLFGLPGWSGREGRSEPLLEVVLSPAEARTGVLLPIEVPAEGPCPECGRAGLFARFMCASCAGTGRVRTVRRVSLELPARTRHGAEFQCDLGRAVGLRFRVRVLVEASEAGP